MFDTSNKTTKQAAPKKNGLMIGLIACMGVIIVLLGAVVVLLLGRGDDVVDRKDEEPKRNVVVNKDNVDKITDEMNKTQHVRPGNYEAKMNAIWHFPDGSSPSTDAYVENVLRNTHDVYFDVELANTGEVILESPVIPRGSYMKDITLDKDLDPGTYDCVLIYHLVDSNQKTVSTLRMAITIIIEG